MSADATAEFLRRLAERGHEPLLARGKGSIQLELSDGERTERWLLVIDRGDVSVSRRRAAADCRVRAEKSLFDAFARGETNAMAAALRGALQVEGDWELLLLLQRLFPGPPGSAAEAPS